MKRKLFSVCAAAGIALFSGCGGTSGGGYDNGSSSVSSVSSTASSSSVSSMPAYMSVELSSLQREVRYLTDTAGMSLYTFDKDTLGMSNCPNIEGCEATWPAFTTPVVRDDFGMAGAYTSYYQHPLYYFSKDGQPGDVKGDDVKQVWHLVYPLKGFTETDEVKLSAGNRKQTYLTDKDGNALYTFDKDDVNVSNCYGMCEQIWPVLKGEISAGSLPDGVAAADFATTTRSDGTTQATYKGMPLYYFANDTAAGDTNGDWVKGVWHLIEINATSVESVESPKQSIGDVAKGETRFFKGCNNCHGDDGRTPALGISRIIADIDDAQTVKALLTYLKNDGAGKSSFMVDVAQGLSDEEINNLSAFIATLP